MCAGAVGSPQLLMLSGIGPAEQLRALGIDPVADLPGVGENLQDHPDRPGLLRLGRAAAPQPVQPRGGVRRAAQPAGRAPGRTCTCSRSCCPSPRPGCQPPAAGFALVAAVVAPDSRGSVRLATADPQAAPVIDPGFLRDQRDLDRLEAGLAMIRQAAASRRVLPGRARPRPGPVPASATRAGLRD